MPMTGKDILRGVFIEKPLHRSEESFRIPSVPSHVTPRQLVSSYLCMGINSPCATCEPPCRYGREWLQAVAEGNIPEKYKKELAARRVREAKGRMKTPDITADMLRSKGEKLNDPELIAAAMVIEELSDQNENKRKRLEMAANRRRQDKLAFLRQLQRDLTLLTAYTGFRLVPLEKEGRALKIVNECLGTEYATLDMTEEEHDALRGKLRFAVGELIARAFCQKEGDKEE